MINATTKNPVKLRVKRSFNFPVFYLINFVQLFAAAKVKNK